MNRKFKVIVNYAHDTTQGFVYDEVPTPKEFENEPDKVWIVDDIGETYCLFSNEYEVVSNES